MQFNLQRIILIQQLKRLCLLVLMNGLNKEVNMFNQTTFIKVKTQFEGIHCWDNCPIEEVAFLKNPHRHIFGVKVIIQVSHNDRDLEFICVKRCVDRYFQKEADKNRYPGTVSAIWDMGRMSCEMVAEGLHGWLNNTFKFEKEAPKGYTVLESVGRLVEIEVSEDGENGAIVKRVYK